MMLVKDPQHWIYIQQRSEISETSPRQPNLTVHSTVPGSTEGYTYTSGSCQTVHVYSSLMRATVEPLNNGHIGTDHFVHYRAVSSFRGKTVLPPYRLVHRKVPFKQRCPLSFIRGSTVTSLKQPLSKDHWVVWPNHKLCMYYYLIVPVSTAHHLGDGLQKYHKLFLETRPLYAGTRLKPHLYQWLP